MNIQLPPDHIKILHRQLENFELLVAARQQTLKDGILYVEMQAVGVEVKCLYKPAEGETFIQTVAKICEQCLKVTVQAAAHELEMLKKEGGKNVIN